MLTDKKLNHLKIQFISMEQIKTKLINIHDNHLNLKHFSI